LSSFGGGEEYPSRPIELVAWASRGGGSDTIVRQGYAQAIRENDIFPVDIQVTNKIEPVVVEGMRYIHDQPPEGYTILNVTPNLFIWPLSQEMELDQSDFTYLGRVGVEPIVMAIRTDDDRFSNAEELKEYASNNTVTVGVSGTGSTTHSIAFLLRDQSDMDIQFVQFDSGGPKTQALVAGDIDVALDKPSAMAAQLENDQLKLIMHFTGETISGYEDIPYVNEVFDFELAVAQHRGAVVHPETPEDRVEYLREKYREIYETDEFQEGYAKEQGVVPAWIDGPEMNDLFQDLADQFDKVFKENNLGIYSDD
jgi:tripartite-type tricarboxylate transporter receptor subunit TctC